MYSNYNDLYTSLYHSGIKGMKWGVRRKATETRHVKTKNGLDVDLVRKDPSIIARALGKISPKIKYLGSVQTQDTYMKKLDLKRIKEYLTKTMFGAD